MNLYLFILPASILASCHHVYYAPNTPNATLFSEKGETRINALYTSGGDSDFEGAELQLGHAVDKHFAVMLNGFTGGVTENTGSRDEKGNGSYLELGAGMFQPLDEKKRWIAELYAGAGAGTVKNDYGLGDHTRVNCTKFFLQPAMGYKSRYFEFAIVPRISFINWKVKESTLVSTENEYVKYDLDYIHQKPSFLAFEPGFLIRAGAENFKLQLGLTFSKFHSSTFLYSNELIETLNATIGASISFNTRQRRR